MAGKTSLNQEDMFVQILKPQESTNASKMVSNPPVNVETTMDESSTSLLFEALVATMKLMLYQALAAWGLALPNDTPKQSVGRTPSWSTWKEWIILKKLSSWTKIYASVEETMIEYPDESYQAETGIIDNPFYIHTFLEIWDGKLTDGKTKHGEVVVEYHYSYDKSEVNKILDFKPIE